MGLFCPFLCTVVVYCIGSKLCSLGSVVDNSGREQWNSWPEECSLLRCSAGQRRADGLSFYPRVMWSIKAAAAALPWMGRHTAAHLPRQPRLFYLPLLHLSPCLLALGSLLVGETLVYGFWPLLYFWPLLDLWALLYFWAFLLVWPRYILNSFGVWCFLYSFVLWPLLFYELFQKKCVRFLTFFILSFFVLLLLSYSFCIYVLNLYDSFQI